MLLSPKLKFDIIFYIVTIPIGILVVLPLILVGIVFYFIPIIGSPMMDKIDHLIKRIARWRNRLPIVKNSYHKAHLFDMLSK